MSIEFFRESLGLFETEIIYEIKNSIIKTPFGKDASKLIDDIPYIMFIQQIRVFNKSLV